MNERLLYVQMEQSIRERASEIYGIQSFKKIEVVWSVLMVLTEHITFYFNFFKGCIQQILLGPWYFYLFLNTLF